MIARIARVGALHQRAEPGHAGRDQQRVGERADQADGEDEFALQPLPQHEGVLRADGDDEAAAEQEAVERREQRSHFSQCASRSIPSAMSASVPAKEKRM